MLKLHQPGNLSLRVLEVPDGGFTIDKGDTQSKLPVIARVDRLCSEEFAQLFLHCLVVGSTAQGRSNITTESLEALLRKSSIH